MPNSITFSSTLLSNSHSTACSSQFTQPKDRRITVLICLLLGSCLLLSTPYNVSQTYSTSSSNKTTSSSTTNTAYKHKAQPWAHAWLPPMLTFSWLLSKNRNVVSFTSQPFTIHLATLHRRHFHALDSRVPLPHNLPSIHQHIPPHNQIQPPAISHFHQLPGHYSPTH